MSSPDGLYEWLAIAAAAAAAIALLLLTVNWITLRRLRRAQKVVLAGSDRDIVRHAEDLQREFLALRDWLDETASVVDRRMSRAERRLDGSIAHTAMIRYDAYGEMTGRQSSSVALVDDTRTGVIVTAIRHRSHSHLYVKQLRDGESDIELSPEERQVLEQAFADRPVAEAPPAQPPSPAVTIKPSPAAAGGAGHTPPEAEPRVTANPPVTEPNTSPPDQTRRIAGT